MDYPDFAAELATRITRGEASRGILICGSGIGMSIAANKIAGIRAALVENPIAARLSREHNDANVLCLGARFVAPEYAAEIARAWLKTPFSRRPRRRRHAARVEKIAKIESRFCQKVGSSRMSHQSFNRDLPKPPTPRFSSRIEREYRARKTASR